MLSLLNEMRDNKRKRTKYYDDREIKVNIKTKDNYFYYFCNKCSLISCLATLPFYSSISENTSYFLAPLMVTEVEGKGFTARFHIKLSCGIG